MITGTCRPRQITIDDEQFIVASATARPEKLGQPFTRWSLRKLAAYLGDNDDRVVTVGRERLRQILDAHGVTFQRTKTWKESNDPDRDAKLDRIEEVINTWPDRCFAFDEFGPLTIRPVGGWDCRGLQTHLRWRNANARHPDLLAAQRKERARVRSEQHRKWGRPRAA